MSFDLTAPADTDGALSRVVAVNTAHLREYAQSRVVQVFRTGTQLADESARDRLLSCNQMWSDAFQRMLEARCRYEDDPQLAAMAEDHRREEAGHNRLLEHARGGSPVIWDPVVAACSAWIVDSMANLSSVGRLVLVHLVLEGGALVALSAGARGFPDAEYFRLHSEDDSEHLREGYEMLARRADWDLDEVLAVIEQGWSIVETVSDRTVELMTAHLETVEAVLR